MTLGECNLYYNGLMEAIIFYQHKNLNGKMYLPVKMSYISMRMFICELCITQDSRNTQQLVLFYDF